MRLPAQFRSRLRPSRSGPSPRLQGLVPRLFLALLPGLFLGCSEGTNNVFNPGTQRDDLISTTPETLAVAAASADRSYHPVFTTGSQPILTVGETDSSRAIVLLRFGALPEAAASADSALLGIRIAGGDGAGTMVVEGLLIDSTSVWSEGSVLWQNRPDLDSTLVLRSYGLFPVEGDTLSEQGFLRIPREFLAVWARRPESGGLALRLDRGRPGSASGYVRILSREAQVFSTDGVLQHNPRLRVMLAGNDPVDVAPTADAFVVLDNRAQPPGDAAVLETHGWMPARALLRFVPDEAQRIRLSSATVLRAVLSLDVAQVIGDDAVSIGVFGVGGVWSEEAVADSVSLSAGSDVVEIPTELSDGQALFDVGPIARRSVLAGLDSLEFQLRSTAEGMDAGGVVFHSREASDSRLRPSLLLIISKPPDPRWGEGQGQ